MWNTASDKRKNRKRNKQKRINKNRKKYLPKPLRWLEEFKGEYHETV